MNPNSQDHIAMLEEAAAFIVKELALTDPVTGKAVTDMAGRINLHNFEEEAYELSQFISSPMNKEVSSFLCSTASLLKIFLTPVWQDLLSTLVHSGVNSGLVVPAENKTDLTIAESTPNVSFKKNLIDKCQWIVPLILIRLNAQTIAEATAEAKPAPKSAAEQ